MQAPASRIIRLLLLLLPLFWLAAVPASAGVERWTQYGPSSAPISDVVLDPHTPSTLWIASGQVYRSDDGGASFRLTASGLEELSIERLAVDPGQPGVLYAASWSIDNKHVLYRSQDGGEHWAPAAGGHDFGAIDWLTVAPARKPGDPGIVFVGAGDAFRSVDGGETFEDVLAADFSIETVAPDLKHPGTLYVATLYERFKSIDFGDTWTDIVEDPANFPPFVHTLAVAPSDPQILYETGDGANVGATWRSRDGGATWQGPFPFHGDVLTVDPVDPDTVYGGSDRGLFVSHDGGESFTEATNGVPPLDIEVTGDYGVNVIAIDPARPRFALAGTPKGLFVTTNRGTAWTALPQRGLAGNWVTNLIISKQEPAHWILSSQGSFFESHDRGRTFVPFADSLARTGQITEIVPDPFASGGRLWAVADYTLFWSWSEGVTWIPRGFPPQTTHLLLAAPGVMLVQTQGGISRSTDAGHSWRSVWWSPFGDPLFLQHVEQDPRNPRAIYGLGGRSEDGGRTWRVWHKFDAVGFDPFRPRTVHLVDGDTLYVTRDNGTTFQAVGHLGLADLVDRTDRVLSLVFDRDRRDVLFAVTYTEGLLRSRDGGVTWAPFNDGLPLLYPNPYNRLLQDPANGQRFYFTTSNGLYRADFSGGPS